jgi:phage baseplate assembly protein W
MEYTIDTSKPIQIDWSARGDQRIVQNVWNLINTWQYEVGYNRIKGMNPAILDKPAPVASTLYIAEVFRVVGQYEPRAKVQEVRFIGVDNEGNMQHEVVIEV